MRPIITFALTAVLTITFASCGNNKKDTPHLLDIVANAQYGETHAYSEWLGRYWEVFYSEADPNSFSAQTSRISIASFDSITALINTEYRGYLYDDKSAPQELICDTCVLWIGTKDYTKYYYWKLDTLSIMWGLVEAESGMGYAHLDLHFFPKTEKRLSEEDLFYEWYRPMFSYYLTVSIKGRPDKSWGISCDSIVPNGNFVITKSGLTYVFNQYEIGCFAIDTTICTIPLSILKECIRPEWRGLWNFDIDENSYSDLENESILYAKLGNDVINAILAMKIAATDLVRYKRPEGKKKLAKLAEYPFSRPYPMKDIQDEKEFIKQFDLIFSDYMLEKMCHMRWQDWMRMGWRGIMHWDGEIWVDEFPEGVKLRAVYDDSIPAANAELRRLEREELTLLGEQDTNCIPLACFLAKDSSILVHISCQEYVEWKSRGIFRVIPRDSALTCPSIKAKGFGREEGNAGNSTCIARDGNKIVEVWDNSYCYSKEQKEAGLIYGCQISDVGDAEIDLEKYESFSFDTAIPLTPVYLRDVAKWW